MHVVSLSVRADYAVMDPGALRELAGSRRAPPRVRGSFPHCIAISSSHRFEEAQLCRKSRSRD